MIYSIDYYSHGQCAPDWKLDDKAIPWYNITFVLGGEATYIINGEEIHCFTGDCLFMYPGTRRIAWTNPENPLVEASFNIADIPWAINLPNKIRFKNNSHINFYIREFDIAYQNEPKNKLQLSAIITLLLCELDTANRSTSKKNPHIDMAEKYIKTNIRKPISAADVAQAIHLDPSYFGALFKRCTGESVMGYINRYKMITAASILSDPKISVTKAAEKVGFSDIYYFSKVFKKIHGISPMAFKKGEFPKKSYESYTVNHADSVSRFTPISFKPQTGTARFSFKLVANELTDGVVGFVASDGRLWNWTDFNIVIQIQPDGLFWAINGLTYNACSMISYEPSIPYTLEIFANIDNATYDAYVIKDDNIREKLADHYTFRSTAPKANDLGKLCVRSGHNMAPGVFYVEDFRVLSDEASVSDDAPEA